MKFKLYLIAICASVFCSNIVWAENCPTFTLGEFLKASHGMIIKEGQPILSFADGKAWEVSNLSSLPRFTEDDQIQHVTTNVTPSGLCTYTIVTSGKSSPMTLKKVKPEPIQLVH